MDEVSWLLRWEKLTQRQMFWKNLKIANFIKKFLTFERLNSWKQIHWNHQPCSNFHQDVEYVFWVLENGQIRKTDKNFRKPWKKLQIFIENAKIWDIKILKTNPLLLETMHRPFIKPKERFFGPLKLEKLKKWRKFSKKKWKKLQKLVSFCVFVFVVPKHTAHKIVIKSKFVSKKASVNF